MLDAAGDEAVELGELAQRIAEQVGGGPVQRPVAEPDAREDRYLGDAAPLRALAAEHGITLAGLDAQIRRTAETLA